MMNLASLPIAPGFVHALSMVVPILDNSSARLTVDAISSLLLQVDWSILLREAASPLQTSSSLFLTRLIVCLIWVSNHRFAASSKVRICQAFKAVRLSCSLLHSQETFRCSLATFL